MAVVHGELIFLWQEKGQHSSQMERFLDKSAEACQMPQKLSLSDLYQSS